MDEIRKKVMQILEYNVGNEISDEDHRDITNDIMQLIKQARNNEIEALVTHIQDKFEEVEVLLNEYQYVRTRQIDAEDGLTEGGNDGDSE